MNTFLKLRKILILNGQKLKKYLVKNQKLIVIQINGKKRNTITIENDISEKELINLIKDKQLISKYINNGELIKTIYIKDKLINFIIR